MGARAHTMGKLALAHTLFQDKVFNLEEALLSINYQLYF